MTIIREVLGVVRGGVVPLPRWILIIRALQAVISIIIVTLTGIMFTFHHGSILQPGVIPMMLVAALTLLLLLPATVAAQTPLRRFYDARLALACDGLGMLFWLAAFAVLASHQRFFVRLKNGLYEGDIKKRDLFSSPSPYSSPYASPGLAYSPLAPFSHPLHARDNAPYLSTPPGLHARGGGYGIADTGDAVGTGLTKVDQAGELLEFVARAVVPVLAATVNATMTNATRPTPAPQWRTIRIFASKRGWKIFRYGLVSSYLGATNFGLFMLTTLLFLYYYHRHLAGIPLTTTTRAPRVVGGGLGVEKEGSAVPSGKTSLAPSTAAANRSSGGTSAGTAEVPVAPYPTGTAGGVGNVV